MALPATLVWEVQTTGSDSNGGGFDPSVTSPGTDYTQGAGQTTVSFTDLATDGNNLSVAVSGGRNFVAADVGNTIQITSGTHLTAGFYNIRSVASNKATLDRNFATDNSSDHADGVGVMGGAMLSPSIVAAYKVAGNDVYIKSGTYSITTASTDTAGGCVLDDTGGVAQTNFSWWVGYDTTRTRFNTDTNRPLLQASGSISSLTLFKVTATYVGVVNLIADGASKSTSTGIDIQASYTAAFCCKALNTTTRGFYTSYGSYFNCEATGCSGTASIDVVYGKAIGCYSHDNTTHGFVLSTGGDAFWCIADTNTGATCDGFSLNRSNVFGCISYANGRYGFNAANPAGYNAWLINCIAEANGSLGWYYGSVSDGAVMVNCGGYNNTGGNYTSADIAAVFNFVANTTGSFFVDAANGDFRLNNSPNQGALARGTGYPATLPALSVTGYPDIGTFQHLEPSFVQRIYQRFFA